MSKIRVDADPLILSPEEIVMNYEGLFIESATTIKMPLIKGMEIDQTQKMTSELTQRVRLRRNFEDPSQYHLRLTRFNDFRVIVPVILAETDGPAENRTVWRIGPE